MKPKSTKKLKEKSEILGKSAEASACSVSHPKAPQLQSFAKKQKPQISIIPGISPRERNRYRVLLGDQVLGNQLNIDQAIALAKGGEASV